MTYLVGHLDELRGGTDRGAGHEAAILENVGSLDDGHVEVGVGTVLGVVALFHSKVSSIASQTDSSSLHNLGVRLRRGRAAGRWGGAEGKVRSGHT